MQLLKQSTASTILVGPLLDSSGAAVTNAVIGDFNLTKNGTTAALAAAATATHSHNGHYLISLTTGNTDTVGRLTISANNSAHAMATHRYSVLLASVFDALITNAANATGGLLAATGAVNGISGTIANTINITQASGVSIASGGITSSSFAAGAIDASAIATDAIGANEISAAAVTKIQSGLATASSLATVAGYLDTEIAAILAVTTKVDTMLVLDGSVYQFTANALELGGSSTVVNNYFTTATTIDGSPVAANGRLGTIVIGDDYLATNDRSFTWTVPAVTGFSVGSVVAHFAASAVLPCGEYSFEVTGSASDNGDGTWEVTVDLPSSATSALLPGLYDWSMRLMAGGVKITKIKNANTIDRVKLVTSP